MILRVAPLEHEAVRHAFFTRAGGVSEGVFASLNCSLGSGDDPAKVAENRRRALAVLGLGPERLVTTYQVHGAAVALVEAPWRHEDRPRADALVTRVPGIALGILTADCAPVLFADPAARIVGAAHAGWRGALGGVLEAAVAAMEREGALRARIRAGVGPCIGGASYEVGPEFPAPFLAERADNAGFFVAASRPGHFLFDLGAYVEAKLRRLGLGAVARSGGDTCAEAARFFSWRRTCLDGQRQFGHLLSAICLAP
ncbi:MAG TPA: peptidoglycan editing factor PgeF [Stellaceae bacterium]|nr:peptidoglycan editing factor PgeF [Stellaceae bacterium]